MDVRGLGEAMHAAMVGLFVIGVTAGLAVGGILGWLVPFLFRHLHVAWN